VSEDLPVLSDIGATLAAKDLPVRVVLFSLFSVF